MKAALCTGLLFTYPIMCLPVFELLEDFVGLTSDEGLARQQRNLLRVVFVLSGT